MKQRPMMTALLLALLVSGSCTYLLSRKITSHALAQRAAEKRYVAPARALAPGEVLKAENVELIAWPTSSPVIGASSKPAELFGRVVMYPVERGEPILDRQLAAPGAAIGLAAKIPDGMRAIALKSDEVVGVAGFLVPGSHLDVLVSYRSERSPEPITATVLQDAVVLAAGQQIEPDPSGKPAATTVVTLLLTPEASERALLASSQGAIHFVLRNSVDTGRAKVEPVFLSDLSSDRPLLPIAPAVLQAAAALPRPPAAKAPEIETILGKPDGGN